MNFLYDLENWKENESIYENYNKGFSLLKTYEDPFNYNNSFSLDLDENENLDENYEIKPPFNYLDKPGNIKNISNKEKTTAFETLKTKKEPIFYCFEQIKSILFENELYKDKFSNEIKNKFIKSSEIAEAEENIKLNKKRKRRCNGNNKKIIKDIVVEIAKKRGRKPTSKNKREEHNKMSSDNIIKKIKAYIFKYPIKFLNNFLSTLNSKDKFEIFKLDYKYINLMKSEINLGYLQMPLKDLFSYDITSKYNKLKSNLNKTNIEKILSNQTDETIKFIFNISLREWLDLFTFKKTIEELINEYDPYNIKKIDSHKIEENFVGIDALLNEIKEIDDEKYFSFLIFYLYNYERWFYIKKTRNKIEK